MATMTVYIPVHRSQHKACTTTGTLLTKRIGLDGDSHPALTSKKEIRIANDRNFGRVHCKNTVQGAGKRAKIDGERENDMRTRAQLITVWRIRVAVVISIRKAHGNFFLNEVCAVNSIASGRQQSEVMRREIIDIHLQHEPGIGPKQGRRLPRHERLNALISDECYVDSALEPLSRGNTP
jgi:hypothetical protein